MSDTKSQKLLPAYLAVGEDALKRRTVLERLRKRVAEYGDLEFNHDEFDGDRASGSDIAVACNTLPFASEIRLVEVARAEKLGKQDADVVCAYLAAPNESTVLVLSAEKLAKNTRLYKAVAKVDKKAIVDCTPKKRWELPPQVVRMAAAYGMSMDQQAAAELVSRVGESTTMIDAQLKVLAELCSDTRTITIADVERNITRIAEVKPWDFLDAVCARDAAKALGLYHLMQNPSQVALCSLLTGRVRELLCAKSLDARGQGAALASELGKQAWQVKNHLGWARRFAAGELEHALVACATCERALKSGTDADVAFTELVVDICC